MFNRWNRMSTRSCKASWWYRHLLSSAIPTQSHWQFVLSVVSGSVGIIRLKWWWISLGTPCVKLSSNWNSNFSITYDIWLYCITVYPKLKSEYWHLSLIQYEVPMLSGCAFLSWHVLWYLQPMKGKINIYIKF